jgi:hypothetical protein
MKSERMQTVTFKVEKDFLLKLKLAVMNQNLSQSEMIRRSIQLLISTDAPSNDDSSKASSASNSANAAHINT